MSKIVPLSERRLRKWISEFILHYHLERNHQGIGNELIVPRMQPANENAPPNQVVPVMAPGGGHFIHKLIELGHRDAIARADALRAFVADGRP